LLPVSTDPPSGEVRPKQQTDFSGCTNSTRPLDCVIQAGQNLTAIWRVGNAAIKSLFKIHSLDSLCHFLAATALNFSS
jgi:hypothetical protein